MSHERLDGEEVEMVLAHNENVNNYYDVVNDLENKDEDKNGDDDKDEDENENKDEDVDEKTFLRNKLKMILKCLPRQHSI